MRPGCPLRPGTVRELNLRHGILDPAAALRSEEHGQLERKGTVGTADRLGQSRLLSDGIDTALKDPVEVTDLDEQPQFEISLGVVVLESRLRQRHQKPSVGS